jgi:hypothetical protein
MPYSVEFDGSTSSRVNCGSDAAFDDLADNAFTAEGWFRSDDETGGFFDKKGTGSAGWYAIQNGTTVFFRVYCATTNATASASLPPDGKQHHLAFTWDDAGDRKARIYIDGILAGESSAGVGAIVSDAAQTLYMAFRRDSNYALTGSISWARISDNIRYTADFTPPSRLNPPASDGNTIAQYNFREGSGSTVDNIEGTAALDGTLEGTYEWNITPNMSVDAPGEQLYGAGGYDFGADAVDEGFSQAMTGSPGDDLVCLPVIGYERDYRARPCINVYDDDGAALIVKHDLPWLVGSHDGGNDEDSLQDSSAPRWPQSLVGGTVYNITDGSNGEILQINNFDTTEKVSKWRFCGC